MTNEGKRYNGNRVFFAPSGGGNQYISLMQEAMTLAGFIPYRGRKRYALFKCDIFHPNWYETIGGFNVRRKISFLKRLLCLYVLKVCSKKIIFTLHNRTPHDKQNKNHESRALLLWFLKHSYRIIIHCHESITFLENLNSDVDMDKIVYVPHPNYISAYTGTKPYTNYVKREGELVLLFMGLVRPYKNIETIINAANQLQGITDIHFLICGRGNEDYQKQLLSMIQGSNITADFRFIDDDEVPSLLELSDAFIIPYNTESALNSGAANLAFSFGRTVIGTWTGTTKDVDESLVYCYDYTDNESDHVSRLKNAIMRFYEDFKHDSESVKAKGDKLREMMITEHSIGKVAEGLSKAYA